MPTQSVVFKTSYSVDDVLRFVDGVPNVGDVQVMRSCVLCNETLVSHAILTSKRGEQQRTKNNAYSPAGPKGKTPVCCWPVMLSWHNLLGRLLGWSRKACPSTRGFH